MGRGFSSIGSRKLPASVNRHDALHLNLYASALDEDRTPARKHSMQNLSPASRQDRRIASAWRRLRSPRVDRCEAVLNHGPLPHKNKTQFGAASLTGCAPTGKPIAMSLWNSGGRANRRFSLIVRRISLIVCRGCPGAAAPTPSLGPHGIWTRHGGRSGDA